MAGGERVVMRAGVGAEFISSCVHTLEVMENHLVSTHGFWWVVRSGIKSQVINDK